MSRTTGQRSKRRSRQWTSAVIAAAVVGVSVVGVSVGVPSSLAAPTAVDDVVIGVDEIVGGSEVTPPGRYPFMAGLITTQPGFDFDICGGALLSPTWVVTAAHCLKVDVNTPEVAADISVVVGRHDLTTNAGQRIQAARLIPHPGWRDVSGDDTSNDIALIELASPATVGGTIRVAEPADSALWAAGSTGTVMGWGATNPNGSQPSDVLRSVDVPHRDDAACRGSGYDAALSLCAGGVGGQDSCTGDSGGPLVAPAAVEPFTLVGLVSSGPDPCGSAGAPAIYTEVAAYIDWLETNSGLDLTSPTVTVEQAPGQADPTEVPTITFAVTFSENVTGFGTADVVLSGTAGATTAAVSGSGARYTVTVSGGDDEGTVIAAVRAGAAVDAAGNASRASASADNRVTRGPAFTIEGAATAREPAVRTRLAGG